MRDPAPWLLLLRLLVGAVMGLAGVGKLVDQRGFERTLRLSFSVPRRFSVSLGRLVPALEFLLAGALFAGVAPRAAGFAAEALLALFTVALIAARVRGRRALRCGCFGGRDEEQSTDGLIGRNLLLLIMGAPLAIWIPARGLGLAEAAPIVCLAAALLLATRLAAAFRAALQISRRPLYADPPPGDTP